MHVDQIIVSITQLCVAYSILQMAFQIDKQYSASRKVNYSVSECSNFNADILVIEQN